MLTARLGKQLWAAGISAQIGRVPAPTAAYIGKLPHQIRSNKATAGPPSRHRPLLAQRSQTPAPFTHFTPCPPRPPPRLAVTPCCHASAPVAWAKSGAHTTGTSTAKLPSSSLTRAPGRPDESRPVPPLSPRPLAPLPSGRRHYLRLRFPRRRRFPRDGARHRRHPRITHRTGRAHHGRQLRPDWSIDYYLTTYCFI